MGERLAKRFVLVLLGLQRLSYLVPMAAGQIDGGFTVTGTVLVGATFGWNIAIFLHAYQRGSVPQGVVWLDILWTMTLIAGVPAGLPPSTADDLLGWTTLMGQAAAALAGAALSVPRACLAVALLIGAHGFAMYQASQGTPQLTPETIIYLSGPLWFALIIGFVSRYMSRQGRKLDQAVTQRFSDDSRHTADQARLAHHRALHETVLATLTAIARGTGGTREQVRDEAARDSDYIQRLLRQDSDGEQAPLHEPLAQVIWEVETLGLRVHYVHDMVPDELPQAVIDTVQGATREALYNVLHHADTGTAWLTAITDTEGVVVRIVDRGKGFDTSTAPAGRGLRTHVIGPMAAVGGFGRISSAPGEGTCVELTWMR